MLCNTCGTERTWRPASFVGQGTWQCAKCLSEPLSAAVEHVSVQPMPDAEGLVQDRKGVVCGPDLAAYFTKRYDEVCASSGIHKEVLEGQEPVFCGTTSDKEHIKERAMRPPPRLSTLDAALQCARCSRLTACTESVAREHSPGSVCGECLWLDKSERLADARGDPGRLLDCVAKPPTSA